MKNNLFVSMENCVETVVGAEDEWRVWALKN